MPKRIEDITGQRFGRLVVIEKIKNDTKGKKTQWLCRCDCGNEKIVTYENLKYAHTHSCGCLQREKVKKSACGKRFGKLVAIRETDRRKFGFILWECECDCGSHCLMTIYDLKRNKHGCKNCLGKMFAENGAANAPNLNSQCFDGTNLRNLKREKLNTNNTSGTTGVYWDKKAQKWYAKIQLKNKQHNLGYYTDINDAIAARKSAEEKYFKPVLEEYENQNEGVENEQIPKTTDDQTRSAVLHNPARCRSQRY